MFATTKIGGTFILSQIELYGFDINDFVEPYPDFIEVDDGWAVELIQKRADSCPFCNSKEIYINDHKLRKTIIRHNEVSFIHFLITTTRCKCRQCGATFTPPLKGINRYAKFSNYTVENVVNSCKRMTTFSEIAKQNKMDKSRVIQLFDEAYPEVDSSPLPEVMCLDEIKFFTDIETKYITVIVDFNTGDIVDIVESRKFDVLKEYFSQKITQVKKVKYLVTDMYDGFGRIHTCFFGNAVHIIDLFHVIEDLTRAVNKIRTEVMKSESDDTGEKQFMKNHWRLFLARYKTIDYRVLNKTYHHEKSNREMEYFRWLYSCLNLDTKFHRAYQCLQEMYEYTRFSTYEEGERHLNRIIELLKADMDKDLTRVAETYEKYKVGIINCLDKKTRGFRYTTGIAECVNNHIKTIIKMGYGCLNFARFRKRVLLISRHNKMERKPGWKKKIKN